MNIKSIKFWLITLMALVSCVSSTVMAAEYELLVYKSPVSKLNLNKLTLSDEYRIINTKNLFPNKSRLSLAKANITQTELLLVESDQSLEALMASIERLDGVSHVEPNYPLELYADYSDPDSYKQLNLIKSNALKLWALEANRQVVVAIIDTGIDTSHPDLADALYVNTNESLDGSDNDANGYTDDINGYTWLNWVSGVDHADVYDDHGHGTHLAGIIAARDNNDGVTGINPDALIMPLKIFNSAGKAKQAEAALAVRYAVDQGADIINCSWGYAYISTVLDEALSYAADNGVIVLAAVGNASRSWGYFPAAHDDVIGIGSIDENGDLTEYSNYGSALDYVIEGDIYSTLPLNKEGYGYLRGTSQSTAVMSGLMSRLMAHSTAVTASNINGLLRSAAPFGTDKQLSLGYGEVSIDALLAEYNIDASEEIYIFSDDTQNGEINSLLNAPNPVQGNSTTVYFNAQESGMQATLSLFSMNGVLLSESSFSTEEGVNEQSLDLSDLNNGLYLYAITVEGSSAAYTGKCMILR